jgi:GT2 family glycosyltransferase
VTTRPLVTVIILNYNGLTFLPRCLETLQKSTYSPLELVVVDNNSTDGSLDYLQQNHPGVKIVAFRENLGYAGAYNAVVPQAEGETVVLLNFDVEVEPGWLDQAVELMVSEPGLAAVQPKLRSLQQRGLFEYSGGSGGFIDRFGYPFVRGRLFESLEPDVGQYDDVKPVFWATGAAFVTRKSAFVEAGGLDADFFMHMEELDLCWRYWLMGYEVKVAPRGVVFHWAGAALSAERFHKMYFNHRNGLVMMLKNYGWRSLLRNLPGRLLLDWITVASSLFRREAKRSGAVLLAHAYVLSHLPSIWRKRRRVQRLRKVADRELTRVIYPHSSVWRHFIRKQSTYTQLAAEW